MFAYIYIVALTTAIDMIYILDNYVLEKKYPVTIYKYFANVIVLDTVYYVIAGL